MNTSKMLTVALTYKVKQKNNSNIKANIVNKLNSVFESEEFDSYMHIVTKETAIFIEDRTFPNIECLITMFTTLTDRTVKPVRLLKAYIEENLTALELDNDVVVKLVKRRVY